MIVQALLPSTARGIVWMLWSTLLLAAMHAMVRHVGNNMHPFEIALFRNVFGFVALAPMLLRTGLAGLHSAQPKLQVLRGFLGIGAMLGWFYGLSILPIATATALSFTAAIFASLGAVLLLGEKMRMRRWSAVAFGFIGVLTVLRPGAEFEPGTLLVVASAMMWGANVVIVKQLSRTDSGVSIVAWMSISLTALSILPAMLVWTTPTLGQLLWLGTIGLAGTLGHLCMIRALRLAETTAVMSVDFARLLWTTVFGSLFFADPVDAWTWFGGTVIFASGLYIIYRESRMR